MVLLQSNLKQKACPSWEVCGSHLVAQMVKNLSAMWKTRVRSLGQEDALEKGMTTHSSIFAWRIPWTEEPGGLQSMGSQRVGHDWTANTLTSHRQSVSQSVQLLSRVWLFAAPWITQAELKVNTGTRVWSEVSLAMLWDLGHIEPQSWLLMALPVLLSAASVNIHKSCWVFIKPACSQSKIPTSWLSYYPLPVVREKLCNGWMGLTRPSEVLRIFRMDREDYVMVLAFPQS